MLLQDYVQVMRPAIENELQETIDRLLPENRPELRAMLTYHMGWEGEGAGPEAQGKRIRPLLVLLCAEAAGGDWHNALPAAAAVELLHNFSLVHDDIQDHSELRRNRPTLWVKWGVAQAINAGDVLFTLAFSALHGLAKTVSAQDVLRAHQILQETCLRLTEGQYLDISYETSLALPMEAYWPMIGGKTSALLACCAELGALSAQAAEGQCAHFHAYGYSLGLAFQVLDDWLGIWGDVALTGKSAESDLCSGKKTLPVLFALSSAGEFASRWMQGRISQEEIPDLVRLMEEDGADTRTLAEAQRLTDLAMQSLQAATQGKQMDAARALEELTHSLLRRKA
jgi:geranylgeranyl diphosphate synthase type I